MEHVPNDAYARPERSRQRPLSMACDLPAFSLGGNQASPRTAEGPCNAAAASQLGTTDPEPCGPRVSMLSGKPSKLSRHPAPQCYGLGGEVIARLAHTHPRAAAHTPTDTMPPHATHQTIRPHRTPCTEFEVGLCPQKFCIEFKIVKAFISKCTC